MRKKYHVKKGDNIQIISGNWKGEEAKILSVIRKNDRVVLEMIGLSPEKRRKIGRRTMRKTPDNPHGGLVERSVSVHISNVKIKAGKKTGND